VAFEFVVLNCPGCSAPLEVSQDHDRFACAHCGTQVLVERRGGTIALKALTDAIARVQIGTDKTAAELALARYQVEARELHARLAALRDNQSREVGRGFGCGAVLLVIGLGLWKLSAIAAAVLLVAGGYSMIRAYYRSGDDGLEKLKRELAALESKIAEKKSIADA